MLDESRQSQSKKNSQNVVTSVTLDAATKMFESFFNGLNDFQ